MDNQSSRPLVGMGLATYNRAFYLKKAVDSLLAQTYENFILIIADNASTDETQAVCEAYVKNDPRVRYIRRPENIGMIANLNDVLGGAIDLADFYMLGADDDVWDPQFMEKCMAALLADPTAAMACTGHESFFWDGGRVIGRDPRLYFPDKKDLYGRLKQFTRFYSHDNRGVFIYDAIWRKSVVPHSEVAPAYESDVTLSLKGLTKGPFLMATEETLYHKGTLPGITSTKDMPFGRRKLRQGLKVRFARARNECRHMAILASVPDLSVWQKTKLIFWNLTVVVRLFTKKKV